jgi:hypothetical protein
VDREDDIPASDRVALDPSDPLHPPREPAGDSGHPATVDLDFAGRVCAVTHFPIANRLGPDLGQRARRSGEFDPRDGDIR